MTNAPDARVHLRDYAPFSHVVDQVALRFELAPRGTRVHARLSLRPSDLAAPGQDLRLDGEGLQLLALRLDGQALDLAPDATGLTIPADLLPEGAFTLETLVAIDPEANTALEGLYMSRGMYCTQCEAQGFRRITFYPDRPDVMARFHVRLEGDLPVLLSNGNPVGQGDGWAEWDDPWPKPAYLFALVAGDLVAHRDHFTTASGAPVDLAIWVREGDQDRCAWAMDSLMRSMLWDETVFGREYDLDQFNIVAVDDFNMGAMENKGLNIFNSKFVLASPETATDDDFARIEAIVAHEYFHNWTGNRITCRDWFQLCLKEGLTVWRDQQFSGDMRSHAVKRIEDVALLRARQFREDQGPLAHPVRPESFVEINNFYTATVYEKGAELIGMLHLLLGKAGWKAGCDLYFARHDGQAATIEDWLQVFEDATGRDLSQFALWYSQAGTPRLRLREEWAEGRLTLHLAQSHPPSPGQEAKQPLLIPVAMGLIGQDGAEVLPTTVLELTGPARSWTFEGLAARPVVSILRGFSAPVVLEREMSNAERAFLLAHDSDLFCRWEAGRELALDLALRHVAEGAASVQGDQALWGQAQAALARDAGLDPAFRALALRLPAADEIAARLHAAGLAPDPLAIRATLDALSLDLAQRLGPDLPALITAQAVPGPFRSDAAGAGKRALEAALLALQSRLDAGAMAEARNLAATNMTAEVASLAALLIADRAEGALQRFATRWGHDHIVMDKWFQMQVLLARPEAAVATARRLAEHPDFDWKNPNRFRALIGGLAANHAGFHAADGAGYRFVADWLLRLDPLNPQTAARMSTAFDTASRQTSERALLMRAELLRMQSTPGLSRDLGEMVERMLAAARSE